MVNDSSISTDMWDAVKTLCTTALTDASITASVNATYVAKTTNKPLVVIPPVSTPKIKNKFGSGNTGRYDMTVIIYCYGKNTLVVDQLKQAIENGLETYPIDGVSLSGFEDDYTFAEINDSPIHLITISASYNRE